MSTSSARRSRHAAGALRGERVVLLADLDDIGCSRSTERANVAAGRWQRFGVAVVLHNGPLLPAERHRVVLLNAGPRAVLTAFTAVEAVGLRTWSREATHVLVPGGTHVPRLPGLAVRTHYTGAWDPGEHLVGRSLHRAPHALALAASTFTDPRPACGILAAGVQQRLVRVADLRAAVFGRPRLRHRSDLLLAIADMAQGAEALSEIDFARLCRRAGLPEPVRQSVRRGPGGRRRYLDAEWRRQDGGRVVAEVDGALHLSPRRWWDDQLRQNELVIAGSAVLRFPSVVVRTEQHVVVDQLRRMSLA